MRSVRRVIGGLVGTILMMTARQVWAAGGAPWDTQLNIAWLSITGGPFAALVLGAAIIGIGMALCASEHGSLWRGLPAFVLGGALIAGSQTIIPAWFGFGGGFTLPL
jgi:type IV secretory pathway VirB2 component (pilin)